MSAVFADLDGLKATFVSAERAMDRLIAAELERQLVLIEEEPNPSKDGVVRRSEDRVLRLKGKREAFRISKQYVEDAIRNSG